MEIFYRKMRIQKCNSSYMWSSVKTIAIEKEWVGAMCYLRASWEQYIQHPSAVGLDSSGDRSGWSSSRRCAP